MFYSAFVQAKTVKVLNGYPLSVGGIEVLPVGRSCLGFLLLSSIQHTQHHKQIKIDAKKHLRRVNVPV
jgi:hypothetical protein